MAKMEHDQSNRAPMTRFGLEVTLFCAQHGITKKQLAEEARIPYDTLLKAIKGRRNDSAARAVVQPVMDQYDTTARKLRKKGGAAL